MKAVSIYNNWGTTKPSDRAPLSELLRRTGAGGAFPFKRGFFNVSEWQMIQKFISRDLIVKVPNGAMLEVDFGMCILTDSQRDQVRKNKVLHWWVWNPKINYNLHIDYLKMINRIVDNYANQKESENQKSTQFKLSL